MPDKKVPDQHKSDSIPATKKFFFFYGHVLAAILWLKFQQGRKNRIATPSCLGDAAIVISEWDKRVRLAAPTSNASTHVAEHAL